MSDITKCSGLNCPIKDKCYRFMSETEPRYQSWFVEVPGKWHNDEINKKVWECEMFWGHQNQSIMNQLKQIMK